MKHVFIQIAQNYDPAFLGYQAGYCSLKPCIFVYNFIRGFCWNKICISGGFSFKVDYSMNMQIQVANLWKVRQVGERKTPISWMGRVDVEISNYFMGVRKQKAWSLNWASYVGISWCLYIWRFRKTWIPPNHPFIDGWIPGMIHYKPSIVG